MALQIALIDAGPLIAYYNSSDEWHPVVRKFYDNYKGQLITSEPVATEVMWLLQTNRSAQREFLTDLAQLYTVKALEAGDYIRIADLNDKYKDVPADFADLSIVVLSERLGIKEIVSLDSDFDIYRSVGATFKQLFSKFRNVRRRI